MAPKIAMGLVALILLTLGITIVVTSPKDEDHCGYVKYRVAQEHLSKYSSRTEPIIVVKFDSIERPIELHTTWDTYLSKK